MTVIEPAHRYEDSDDCLTAAAAAVAKRKHVAARRCAAVWGDVDGAPDTADISRDTIIVTIRGSH
jgi:hypothetical protein